MIYSIKSILLDRIDPKTSEPMEIELDMFNPYKNGLAIANVDNTGPVKAKLSVDDWAIVDGGHFNKARTPTRNIVMKLIYVGDTSIEEIRHLVYKYFPTKERVRLEFNNDSGIYCIEGIIEDNNVPMWVKQEQSQISILCENPFFFKDKEESYDFETRIPQFHFFDPSPKTHVVNPYFPTDRFDPLSISRQPFLMGRRIKKTQITVDNPCDMDIGMKISIIFSGTVNNPRVINTTTNQAFYLTGEFEEGTELLIDTRSGHKRVLYGNGSNAISKMNIILSKWIVLRPGENIIKYAADSGTSAMSVSVAFSPLYEGI